MDRKTLPVSMRPYLCRSHTLGQKVEEVKIVTPADIPESPAIEENRQPEDKVPLEENVKIEKIKVKKRG
jgi:hypothetical protein